MNRTTKLLIFFALIVSLVSAPRALDHLLVNDQGTLVFGDNNGFLLSDTLNGAIHSNSQIAILDDPQFYDQVSSSAPDFWRGPHYNPYFRIPPIFNAPRILIPDSARTLRQGAMQQDLFYPNDGKIYYLVCDSTVGRMFRWHAGTPIDSSDTWNISIGPNTCLFVDAPLWVRGRVEGKITIGSSHLIRIMDDITTMDANDHGEVAYFSENMIGLVSEGDVKIGNTAANGRRNSANGSNVVITAAVYALGGTFTFEDQNDPDSGYVCDCSPDMRGTIFLFGGIVQRQRGHVRRSNNSRTGYNLKAVYDNRLQLQSVPCMTPFSQSSEESTDSLNFGDVVVGTTAWDTARVYTYDYAHLGAVYASNPFFGVRQAPFQGDSFVVPASFTPPREGVFSGILYVTASANHFSIVLRGRGVPDTSGAAMTLTIAPNPFNLTTTIRYSIPDASDVKFVLYDILGREAVRIDLAQQSEGEHVYSFNASDLASGVYFLTLQTAKQHKTVKLLLVK